MSVESDIRWCKVENLRKRSVAEIQGYEMKLDPMFDDSDMPKGNALHELFFDGINSSVPIEDVLETIKLLIRHFKVDPRLVAFESETGVTGTPLMLLAASNDSADVLAQVAEALRVGVMDEIEVEECGRCKKQCALDVAFEHECGSVVRCILKDRKNFTEDQLLRLLRSEKLKSHFNPHWRFHDQDIFHAVADADSDLVILRSFRLYIRALEDPRAVAKELSAYANASDSEKRRKRRLETVRDIQQAKRSRIEDPTPLGAYDEEDGDEDSSSSSSVKSSDSSSESDE